MTPPSSPIRKAAFTGHVRFGHRYRTAGSIGARVRPCAQTRPRPVSREHRTNDDASMRLQAALGPSLACYVSSRALQSIAGYAVKIQSGPANLSRIDLVEAEIVNFLNQNKIPRRENLELIPMIGSV